MTSALQRLNPTARYADATIFNGIVQAVEVPAGGEDIRAQTASLLAALDATLVQAGSGRHRLLMATVYLTDMGDYAGMNDVWQSWLPPECAPARACVQVAALADPAWRVEIAVTAAVGG
ncbi:MAG: RidA family protein [Candidatus Dactylopiibacterium sp.]|nr:RidA family protein [Candidatus Dactylopiibacterium sp.]